MSRQHIHFVTSKLAETTVRDVLESLAPAVGFDYSVQVLNITVAALMTTEWVARRIAVPQAACRVILPGYCRGELSVVEAACGVAVERGPKDIRQLPDYFGQAPPRPVDYGRYDIEIIAEINHAPRLSHQQILAMAEVYRQDGADVIDVGCDPGETWTGVGEVVRLLRSEGHRVSVDSYNPVEINAAAQAGAELVLSVNQTNRSFAADWGVEVVAVPDDPATLAGLEETIAVLEAGNVSYRLDPILEPIGFGFLASLIRYWKVRQQFPEARMMMGIGNLTELTDVDSSGVNTLLLAACQELQVGSVLTTQVINWARSAVRECDVARRLVYHAITRRSLPKRVETELVMLRDPELVEPTARQLRELAEQVKDRNYRLFTAEGRIHVINAVGYLCGEDPFELFEQMLAADPKGIDASHAFYLGYEMAKAVTAMTLGKNYEQDQALHWGFLTRPEVSYRDRKQRESKKPRSP